MQQFMKDSKKMTNFLELHVKPASRRQYSYHLELFFLWKKVTNIDEYIKDPRRMNIDDKITYEDNIKNDISGYWKYINEDSDRFHGKTAYTFISPMKRFLETYETVFSPEFWKNLRNNGNGNYTITDLQTPTKQQLKAILSNADLEARALFLVQMTSGQRIKQVVNLKWDDIKLEHDYPRIFIRKQKWKRPIYTRITPEAKEYLEEYKNQFDRFVTTREQRTPDTEKKPFKPLDRTRVFPMSESNAETMWNNLTDKVGLYKLDPITHVPLYGTHCLRRYFQSHLGNESDALFFMGKTPENIATYMRLNPEELDLHYIRGAENLVVFKEKSETPEYLKEQDKKLTKINNDLETSNKYNDILKERLKSQEDRLNKIEKLLKRKIYDNYSLFTGPELSKEENKLEDRLDLQVIEETEEELKHVIATDPKYKNHKIVYTDQYWNDKTQSFKHGAPFIIKKEKPKTMEEIDSELTKAMNKDIVLNAFINLDKDKQQKLIKKANKIKQSRIAKPMNELMQKQDEEVIVNALASIDRKEQQETIKDAETIRKEREEWRRKRLKNNGLDKT